MKKIIIFISLGLKLFSLEGSIGLGTINSSNKYTGEEASIIVPAINLKYKNYYLRGTELGYSTKIKERTLGTGLQFSVGGDLKEEDIDYKIKEERKAPLYLGFYGSQNILGGGSVELKYQKEFQSMGDIVSITYSHFVPLKLPLLFIPYIKYSLRDDKYTNYYLGLRPKEIENWNTSYEEFDNSSKVDFGFTSTLFLTKKMRLSMVYNREFLDDNHSDIVKNEINSTFIASLLYKF